MDYPKIIVSNQKEKSIRIQRVRLILLDSELSFGRSKYTTGFVKSFEQGLHQLTEYDDCISFRILSSLSAYAVALSLTTGDTGLLSLVVGFSSPGLLKYRNKYGHLSYYSSPLGGAENINKH